MTGGLKTVYQSPTEEAALMALFAVLFEDIDTPQRFSMIDTSVKLSGNGQPVVIHHITTSKWRTYSVRHFLPKYPLLS